MEDNKATEQLQKHQDAADSQLLQPGLCILWRRGSERKQPWIREMLALDKAEVQIKRSGRVRHSVNRTAFLISYETRLHHIKAESCSQNC